MALQDKIGRKDIVDKICGLVDSLQKDQNFCLSINGAWGSGKSFVLQMIKERLSKKQEYIIVKYDAWENTFYSDPLIAILSCVLDGIDEKLYLVERSEAKAKKAIKTGINTLAKLSAKIKALKEIISGIKSVIKSFHNPIDTEAMGEFKSYQKLLAETKEVLNEITQKGEFREKQTKLIVLVDEIDRCLPDEQLKILERLHHLFDIKNCAVIVTMNQNCIVKTVNTIYGINGFEYLRKFFNYTFKLEILADEYLQNLLNDFEKNLKKTNEEQKESDIFPVNIAYQCLFYGKNKVLEKTDNREISRYYNALLNICGAFGWERLSLQYIFFIIVGLYIRKIISPTFLSEAEMRENQERIDAGDIQEDYLDFNDEEGMPYFDYLFEYLGIDRQDLPEEICKIYRWNHSYIPEFSWDFNEIVFYSYSKKPYNFNQMRKFRGQHPIIVDDCKELRRLIILYGGEPERCDK